MKNGDEYTAYNAPKACRTPYDFDKLVRFSRRGAVTPNEMRVIDANAVGLGIPSEVLMENAGRALAECMKETVPCAETAVFLCGHGNNGGDGFVAARFLSSGITKITVIYQKDAKYTPESRSNLDKALNIQEIEFINITDGNACSEEIKSRIDNAEIIADCILGTGAHGGLRGPFGAIAASVNASHAKIVSADIPSPSLRSDFIVSFHREKILPPEIKAGLPLVCAIGIPLKAELFTGRGTRLLLPEKKSSAHKGQSGHLLICGGSYEYQGAPYLAGLAALRSGTDIVRIATFTPPDMEFTMKYPDLIVQRLNGAGLDEENAGIVSGCAGAADVMLIGCGLGNRSTDAVNAVISACAGGKCRKFVIDADALSPDLKFSGDGTEEVILTPHAAEFMRISGTDIRGMTLEERAETVLTFARAFKEKHNLKSAVILQKGEYDVITDGERLVFNETGTSAMTKGGTGDVLAGLTAGLFTRMSAYDAASLAAYAAGLAGESAATEFGDGLLAGDLPERIAKILFTDNCRQFR